MWHYRYTIYMFNTRMQSLCTLRPLIIEVTSAHLHGRAADVKLKSGTLSVCEAGCRAVNSIIIIVVVVGVVVCRTHIFFCHHPAS